MSVRRHSKPALKASNSAAPNAPAVPPIGRPLGHPRQTLAWASPDFLDQDTRPRPFHQTAGWGGLNPAGDNAEPPALNTTLQPDRCDTLPQLPPPLRYDYLRMTHAPPDWPRTGSNVRRLIRESAPLRATDMGTPQCMHVAW
jgi:hypothetical protein